MSYVRRTRPRDAAIASTLQQLNPLEGKLMLRLVECGTTTDEGLVGEVLRSYGEALGRISPERRAGMLDFLVGEVAAHKLSANALLPFLLRDTDGSLVARAALHSAWAYPVHDDDPLHGARELTRFAHRLGSDGDEGRAAAILAGLLTLGDRRIFDVVGSCWRQLGPGGRRVLLRRIGGQPFAALVEWLVSWLEECNEAEEMRAVAAALAAIPSITRRDELRAAGCDDDEIAEFPDLDWPAGVVEIHRTFPVWSVSAEGAVVEWARVPALEFGKRIAPRLLQFVSALRRPDDLAELLAAWGIDPPACVGDETSWHAVLRRLEAEHAALAGNDSETAQAGRIALSGAAFVARQMADAAHDLRASPEATERLQRLVRLPWMLGYLRGVSLAIIGCARLPVESPAVATIFDEVHRSALGILPDGEVRPLPDRARESAEFTEGMVRGGRDALAHWRGQAGEPGLLRWIQEQMAVPA